MDARGFDGISRAVATGTSRRQVARLLAGGALAGAGLVRLGAAAEAISGNGCCAHQRRDFRAAQRDCARRGGQFPQTFSCEPATCDPTEEIAYLCLLGGPVGGVGCIPAGGRCTLSTADQCCDEDHECLDDGQGNLFCGG